MTYEDTKFDTLFAIIFFLSIEFFLFLFMSVYSFIIYNYMN